MRRIMLGNVVGLLFGFVLVAAQKTGSFQVELAQVGARRQIVGIQRHGAFEFGLYLACQAKSSEGVGVLRFSSHGAPQPEVIRAVLRLKRNAFSAMRTELSHSSSWK